MNGRGDIHGQMFAVLNRIADRLPPDQLDVIGVLIDAGEWEVALEQIADVLAEDEHGLRIDERDELLGLNMQLTMGDRVPYALLFCPQID